MGFRVPDGGDICSGGYVCMVWVTGRQMGRKVRFCKE